MDKDKIHITSLINMMIFPRKGDKEDLKKVYGFLYSDDNALALKRKKDHFKLTIETVSQSKEDQTAYVKKEQAPRLTKNEFISKAIEVHGSSYDYSLVDYTKNDVAIKIMCPKHGV